ncbi:MAG: outer membrane protein assembly factor BamD [Deltaproteobacteria bacterium]|nr:outer membrane protein assembly factor BamD [Deltaproteobacteria bacterium]MBN2674181.1 outer membrane protein assembly factor BamD [Deltaproteobacteria bacterium]
MRIYSASMLFIWLVAALGLNGCFFFTSRDDGERLKQEVQHLQDRLTKLENDSGANRHELEEMIARAQQQVENMDETLSKATRVLARNSADFGAEMEEMKNDLISSKGASAEIMHELEEMRKALEANEKRVVEFALAAGLDMPIDEAMVPKEAIDHFNMIKDSMSKGRYGEVRSLAKVYQDRYPRANNLDEVQLLIGQSYVAQKRYAKALGALRRFADLYPKSEHMPEVLYEMANSFYMLGDCTDARILVDTIQTRFKSSSFASKAAKLKETMDGASAKCTS